MKQSVTQLNEGPASFFPESTDASGRTVIYTIAQCTSAASVSLGALRHQLKTRG